MQIAAQCSTASDAASAVRQAAAAVARHLAGPPQLVLAWATPEHRQRWDELAAALAEAFPAATRVGCSAEGVVCNAEEYETGPAVVVWAAHAPHWQAAPLHLQFNQTADGGTFEGWPADGPASQAEHELLLLLGEPYSFPADWLLERLAADRPNLTICGGMASGGAQPGENRLLCNERTYDSGAVAVLLRDAHAQPVVSQGCKPVGTHFLVTRAERNLIFELGGRPALERLEETFSALPAEDARLVRNGLHLGRVTNEYQERFARGDFLVRNVVGADPQRGVLAVGDFFRVGQTVQFHVRDATTADEDLRELLAAAHASDGPPVGGLLFTCNGRGTRLFDEPHHDSAAVARQWPGLPLAGFFAQGEIGPVGRRSWMHGFTASLALFRGQAGG